MDVYEGECKQKDAKDAFRQFFLKIGGFKSRFEEDYTPLKHDKDHKPGKPSCWDCG